MVSGLLALVFVALLQLGLFLHTRNTLIASAAEGARAGARAGATEGDAAGRARWLIESQLADRYAQDLNVTEGTVGGVRVVTVTVVAPIPVLGPFGPARSLRVAAHAFAEDQ